jgi:hypothetical protein
MNKFVLAAAILAATAAPGAAAVLTSVEDVGSILNESLALPAEDTPGSNIGFQEFFEFSLPTKETVTLSVSDSGFGNEQVVGGVFSVNTQTSTGPGPLFIPAGALIDSTPLNSFIGGQEALLGPNVLGAGAYFAELTGTSGSSPIHLAIDGTVTAASGVGATATPEPSTWAMLIVGFGFMAWGAATRRKVRALIA